MGGPGRLARIIRTSAAEPKYARKTPNMPPAAERSTDSVKIVGVAGDAKYMEIREAMYRTIYMNTFQEWSLRALVCRTIQSRSRNSGQANHRGRCARYGDWGNRT